METSDLSHHILSRFNADLEGVRSAVLQMGGLVEQQLRNGVKAIYAGDARLGEEVTRLGTTTNSNIGGLQVLIGGEGEWDELRQCSMVIARYGVPGMATGTLGVLGPMRMSYARTIPTVRYVAGLLSDLVNDTISGE